MEDYRLIETEEDQEDFEEEEAHEEGEEVGELIPAGRMMPSGITEDDDYMDEHDEEEDSEEEEAEELIPAETTSPSVSNSITDSGTLQGAVVINDVLLEESNDLKSCEGKPMIQENGCEKKEFNRGEIDGLFCPICFEAWTSGGEHRICCLPCGHIYGLSCIRKWLQRSPSSKKCPQCKGLCTLKDVRVLYAARLCVADEELHKRVQSLEAKCANLQAEATGNNLSSLLGLISSKLQEDSQGSCDRPPWVDEIIGSVGSMTSQFKTRMENFESRMDHLESRMGHLESRMHYLDSTITEHRSSDVG